MLSGRKNNEKFLKIFPFNFGRWKLVPDPFLQRKNLQLLNLKYNQDESEKLTSLKSLYLYNEKK